MKKIGYRRRFAGAVEAAASTGGMLMPPVMGAGAFVMAEITGIAYIKIVIAAMLGACLYYASLILRVHFVARKEGLTGVEGEDILPYRQIFKDSYLLIPMVALVVLLVKGYSPFLSAGVAIGITFLLSFVKKETMMGPRNLWNALRLGGANMVMIAMACAGAGMVVSVVTYSGLALGIATVITDWAGGHMLVALFLIMITSLVLGMGLPCTPAYIIAITVGGPALLAMGCKLLTAHLFVFYFAILAGITPPVCVPAYCAAAIAQSNPLKTGFEAFKLAIVGFLIPYVFVFNKGLLMQGTILEIITAVIVMFAATVLFAAGLSGYLFSKVRMGKRILLLLLACGGSILCASPRIVNSPEVRIAILLILLAIVFRHFYARMNRSAPVMMTDSN
jgi:TRAP transporter 4TM/12TM fusion protein